MIYLFGFSYDRLQPFGHIVGQHRSLAIKNRQPSKSLYAIKNVIDIIHGEAYNFRTAEMSRGSYINRHFIEHDVSTGLGR